ncbi:MAG: helix-turn-helix domain-containing protein [Bacteroidota bacterium]
MNKELFRSNCPISSSLDLFGDKWTLLIVRDLLYHGSRTFKDLFQSEENIPSSRLADRLKKLENMEAITKEKHPTNKKVFIYKLTQKGKDLAPTIIELITWGNKHLSEHISEESKDFYQRLENDKESVLTELIK